MCGFTGCFFLNKKYINNKFKTLPLNHRGPDDFEYFNNDFLKVNFFRLKILGGAHGKQPMISENKEWLLVFNGEIYNYIELAKKIGRQDLIKKGDTRVLIELIALKGLKAINLLNGMFSIALFNLKKKKNYLIRDRFGIKPLYYKINKDMIYFSSEIKSIPIDSETEVDIGKIDTFLQSEIYPKTPSTFYDHVFEIEGGTINEFIKQKIKTKRYYSLENRLKINSKKKINLEHFEKALENSIKLRMRSDVPISLHFSGGIDSTALICKLKEMFGQKIPLKLYFMNYLNKNNVELIRAKKICQLLKVKLNVVNFKQRKIPEIAKKTQYFLDEPFGGLPVLGMSQLNKYQKKKIPVSIEGQGSDEIFAGYFSHSIMAMRDMLYKKKDEKILNQLKKKFKLSTQKIIKISNLLLKNNFGGSTDANKILFSPFKIKKQKSFLRTIELFNIKINKLPRVLRFHDRISSAHSRELRFPFLDHNVVEMALSLENKYKFKNGLPKYPLHRITDRHLPSNLFKQKISNMVPELKMLLSNKNWILKNLNDLKKFSLVKDKFFIAAYLTLKSNKKQNSFHLWQLININLFLSHFKKLKKFYSR